jgi:hypothetical protein
LAASRAVIALYDEGALKSPRLAIAREIEGDLLDIAQTQVQAAETNRDNTQKQVQLAIAAFLAGAALEDALRRLCDARGVPYDVQRTSVSKLQAVLYQPSKQVEVITVSENKQITVWGDTRNKADHGRFAEITHTEVLAMVIGVRAFIEKHLHVARRKTTVRGDGAAVRGNPPADPQSPPVARRTGPGCARRRPGNAPNGAI